ncbi:MAG: hypothetical protein C9356_06590 [Oleiphilus sp.]|nr:MAG: hypothetical protein C9356_06590 [Oleiphilus sp.]
MTMSASVQNKCEGVGIGLRSAHYQDILGSLPDIPWFEVLIDNYMNEGGYPLYYLDQISQHYPLSFHSVGLSLGGMEALEQTSIARLKSLIDRYQPALVSDHLCWTAHAGLHSHDLLPMPYTAEAVRHVAARIDQVQNALGRRILVENVSSYMQYQCSDLSEAQFFAEVVESADCDILCDLNNIYVSASNHDFDAMRYLEQLPVSRIRELHLAGYEDQGRYLLDTHGEAVHAPVWALYEQALQRWGDTVPTLIEWDNNIPAFSVLLAERDKALQISRRISGDPVCA